MSGDKITHEIELGKFDKKNSSCSHFYVYSILLLAYLVFGFSTNEMFSITPIISLIMLLFAFIKFKLFRMPILLFFGLLSLPLIMDATLLVYKQLLLIMMGGFSAWGTDIYVEFSNDKLNTVIRSLYFINQVTMIIVSCLLITLSFRNLTRMRMLYIPFLFTVIFLCWLYTAWNFDYHIKMLMSGKDPNIVKTDIIKLNSHDIYTISYDDGNEWAVYQKMNIPMGGKFVRQYRQNPFYYYERVKVISQSKILVVGKLPEIATIDIPEEPPEFTKVRKSFSEPYEKNEIDLKPFPKTFIFKYLAM